MGKREKVGTYVDRNVMEDIRDMAYWERTTITSLVETALREFHARAVRERDGPYAPRPDRPQPAN